MAIGIFRKIGNFFKKVGKGIATGAKWVGKNVLTVPATVYHKVVHPIADKIPIISSVDGLADRAARGVLKAKDGDWKGAAQEWWGNGQVIKDVKNTAAAMTGAKGAAKGSVA